MNLATACVQGVCVCLLPREDNNDRPYALRHGPLALTSALLLAIKILTVGLLALTPAQAELSTITVNRITQLTNQERVKVGLQELTTSSALTSAAHMKGLDMLEHDYFAHISPTGVTPWFWMAKSGYEYQVAGENLAIDFTEAEDVVSAWIASPSHKENMLRADYTETGVAVVTGEFEGGTSTVVVHMFGKPAGGSQVAADTAAITTEATPTPAPTQTTTTPTPTPVITPTVSSPTPPTQPPVDRTPPRVPRISSPDGSTIVKEHVQLFIEGEEESLTHLLLNNEPAAEVPLSTQGKAIYALDIAHVHDGQVTVRGYSTDAARNRSALSDPLLLTKDTQAPTVAREEISFFVSPFTERSEVIMRVPDLPDIEVRLAQGDDSLVGAAGNFLTVPSIYVPLSVAIVDTAKNTTLLPEFQILPQFNNPSGADALRVPAQFASLGRQITIYILVIITVLLMLTIIIRIRIQHPGLITHGAFVIFLGAILLVV